MDSIYYLISQIIKQVKLQKSPSIHINSPNGSLEAMVPQDSFQRSSSFGEGSPFEVRPQFSDGSCGQCPKRWSNSHEIMGIPMELPWWWWFYMVIYMRIPLFLHGDLPQTALQFVCPHGMTIPKHEAQQKMLQFSDFEVYSITTILR